MPISLGGLLSGATSAVTGAQQGKLDRKKYEEEAMRQLLAQQLTEAQIGQYQQSAQDRASQAAEAQRQWEFRDQLRASNPEYANLPDNVLDQVAAANAKPPQQHDGQYFVDDNGNVTFSAGGQSGRPVAGVKGHGRATRDPTDAQSRSASFGTRLLEAHAIMARLERSQPGIGQRVDAKMRPQLTVEAVGGPGKAIARLMNPATLSAMTPDEQEYWGAMTDFGNAKLRRETGAAINLEEVDREVRPYVPMAGSGRAGEEGIRQRRMQQALLLIRGGYGAFDPDLLSPEARALLGEDAEPQPDAEPVSENAPGTQGDGGTGGWRHRRPR